MTVRWERFSGDTDIFAVRIAFMPDPDVDTFARSADSASWGALQLWVDGQNLCSHVDQGEVLHSTHWYLLPFLEWVADNWNALLHEERLPNRNSSDTAVRALSATRLAPALAGEEDTLAWDEERFEWRARHAVRFARDGGLFPNIVIRRIRDDVEVSWNDDSSAGSPSGFRYNSSAGAALLDPLDIAGPLFEVVSAAVAYLKEMSPTVGRISAVATKLDEIRAGLQSSERLGWLAGLRESVPVSSRRSGSFADTETEMQDRWRTVVDSLQGLGDEAAVAAALETEQSPLVVTGSCQAALLFSSVSPDVTSADVHTLTSILIEQYRGSASSARIDELAEDVPLHSAASVWEQGYELADTVHARLELDLSEGWVDVVEALARLGVTTVSRKLDDRYIRACCLVGPHHVPTVVQNETSSFYRSGNAQRFNFAHELCHLLFDRSHGRRVSIASGPWAPRSIEQRANAFAAMFLMPTGLVEQAVAGIPDSISELSSITAVAATLHVSRHTAIHHLYNMTLMSESDREDLLRQAHD